MSQEQFPILARGVYANHAAVAPWPRVTAEAIAAFAEENVRLGPERYKDWIARERDLRRLIAELIGVRSVDDIALLKNTSEGISVVAFGYPWQSGDNLVLPQGEFSSNRLPWLAQERLGVDIREVDVRATDDPESALIDAMDANTRILAVSSVQFSDGLRLDLRRLGDACRSAGVLFFVDAIQQLGALPLDVNACHIDFLAADAHKWLLGPEGVAVFYSREPARSQIRLNQMGWHMFDNPWILERSDWSPARSARRFEAGSPNTLGQVGLHASLALILETGMAEVSRRVLRNTRHLIDGLSALPGVTIRSSSVPERQSGIVNFGVRSETREVLKRLKNAGVGCALRGDGIRISPHFYQDEVVMEDLLGRIEDAL
jgi:selenocysteine lyase/cysteine desulfurase